MNIIGTSAKLNEFDLGLLAGRSHDVATLSSECPSFPWLIAGVHVHAFYRFNNVVQGILVEIRMEGQRQYSGRYGFRNG